MDTCSVGWISLVFFLFLTTFGLYWCFTLFISLIAFIIGLLSLLYVQQGDIDKFYRKCAGNPLTAEVVSEGGLHEVVKQLTNLKKIHKQDSRVTGSELIDSSLQEILGYIVRDYITPWYNLISVDGEFPEITVKKTAQCFAVNISNKIKEVDWIPYLTTRLVDDAASHLRLFKQARAKMKLNERKSPRNSPHKEPKSSPKKMHKRNKSETDATWYYGVKNTSNNRDSEHSIGNSKFYMNDQNKKNFTLEDHFFDLECQMENYVTCRDIVCIDLTKEKEFLSELIELLLYILLPDEDFLCKPLRFILREIFSNCVILPLFSMISDPDYINQAIIWLCLREVTLPSEIFLSVLRLTDNCDELKATKELVSKEIQVLRSRDSGGESDLTVKQQLSSLIYVIKVVDNRLSKMDNFENMDAISTGEDLPFESAKKIDLPLDVILKNNVALSYFIDFVSSRGKQNYLYFYLNVEGWKVSVEQQLADIHINRMRGVHENVFDIYETIRSTALSIYEQYLGDKCEPQKIFIKPALVQMLHFKIRNLTEDPSDLWFDEVQNAVYDIMKTKEDFLPTFKKSTAYLKLLEELDLVQQNIVEEDRLSLNSLESVEVGLEDQKNNTLNQTQSNLKIYGNETFLTVDSKQRTVKHVRSLSDVTCFTTKTNELESAVVTENNSLEEKKKLMNGDYILSVDIIETGIVCEKGKTFGIYAMRVSKQYDSNFMEEWHIYRRYSDFHDLHTKVKDKFQDLSKLTFPGKKTFHNMDRAVLERRMRMLGSYMRELCQPHVIIKHPGLKDLLMTFLEQGDYDKATSGGPIAHTIDTLVNPLRTGMKTIKNMPEQLINTVDEVVEGLSKVFHGKPGRIPEASKVGASIDIESDDNIPLRIMLLLMDEVFDLKSRNQWLRRRIITLLRQIVRTMFGDIVNRRILDYVSFITSPKNVAHYLHMFKQSYWPNGMKAENKPDRDENTRHRTRVAAKIALLSCLSDELKHIIGSETTRRGLLTVFELFQRPILNRRLLYVLLEGVLCTLFPEKNMLEIFRKLHSKSRRIQEKQKDSSSNVSKNR